MRFPKLTLTEDKEVSKAVADGAQAVRTKAANGVRGVAAYVEHPSEIITDARENVGGVLNWLADSIKPEDKPAPKRRRKRSS